MNNIKIKLKWKLTLFTVLIMTITSGILLFSINYDVRHTVPQLKGIINSNTEDIKIDLNGDFKDEIDKISIESAIEETTSRIYWFSIIAFILVVTIGGMCTYFVVNNALIPIVELNKNIKKINEDNLNSNLSIKGANDEIKELTISFNKMIAKLENAFASQKRFNSSVAHELKTPLAVIKTNIDVLKSSNCKSLEEYDKTLAVVEKSILKMNLIIETLLDIIRQENAPLNEIVSIDEILEDIVDDLSIIANKKNIKLKLNSYNIKNKIKGNEIMLYRAFYNVIENSIKYNKINGSIDILCYQDLNTIEVKVIDTGSGIKEEDYDEIFKPFYRCEGINSYSKNGIGLGLSLTQSVIKLHGGEINVKSKLNEGTEFTFILPYIV
ncbi:MULTISPECIES: sensor histidine kinase [Clostridium]|uniref:histidine kinase n=2 Tax=Clostridium TaxID=1485 RepID=A0A174JJS0_9CLOT|nr:MULTISPECIES: HAMP domain-containing sensor histidine kinase [Clostridium]MBX9186429.1 HAMP domain-containing histidine kinase [Clostridium sp. K04]MDU3522762.1 HAMP domain-containing sensor histidine kinase [Clostridium saudiense]MDU7455652.1 HAMP domain-containing sensor histidine kinase [Clostridium saudiense]CUO82418.1 integral membrane sensor signal transduction histidine kinase [Clostridium disporicum]CUO97390.1 integral membrane sensor signal transduction histidine kinase [Clostridiu